MTPQTTADASFNPCFNGQQDKNPNATSGDSTNTMFQSLF